MFELVEKYFSEYAAKSVEGGSIILAAFPYVPFDKARIDAYYVASNAGYKKMNELAKALNDAGFQATAKVNAPLKSLALELGLVGASGYNTLTYRSDYGSRFYIGAIFVGGDYPEVRCGQAVTMPCAKCNLCQKACPVNAIKEGGGLDVSKCIRQHMNIGQVGDDETARAFGGRVLGCDICQRVCPKNKKAVTGFPDGLDEAVDAVLTADDLKPLSEYVGKNYAKRTVQMTNLVILEAGNSKRKELLPYIEKLASCSEYKTNAERAIRQLID